MAQNLPLISPNKFKFNPDNLYPKGEQHGTEHCGKLYSASVGVGELMDGSCVSTDNWNEDY